jgi:acetylglutamate kinase
MVTTVSATAMSDKTHDHLLEPVVGEMFKAIEALRGKILVIKLGGSTLEHQQTVLQDAAGATQSTTRFDDIAARW